MLYPLSDHPRLEKLVRRAVPDYRKRKASVDHFPSAVMDDTYWHENTRYSYTIVYLDTWIAKALPQHEAPENGGATPTISHAPGMAVVKHGIFLGSPGIAFVMIDRSDWNRVMS